jgi:hypothetical protein
MLKTDFKFKAQKGNVLFLILIAVALFAALSYAVTQSSRSGGSADRETSLLNSAQITQYPTALQTAALRMIIDGASVSSIYYNVPSAQGTASNQYLFHPNGGGAVYSTVPADLMAGSGEGFWAINGEFFIQDIGTSAADIIAFLPGIPVELCKKINVELGVGAADGTPPVLDADQKAEYVKHIADQNDDRDFTVQSVSTVAAGANDVTTINSSPDELTDSAGTALDGKAFGCFENGTTSEYVYYHTIVER